MSSKSCRFNAAVGVVAAVTPSPLSRPRMPSESAGGLLRIESLGWPLSEPDARDDCRATPGSSFAQSKELEEPYSHSEWRLAQLEQVGLASSHCKRGVKPFRC
jgi:hypothetical protein